MIVTEMSYNFNHTFSVIVVSLNTYLVNDLFNIYPIQMHVDINLPYSKRGQMSTYDHHLNQFGIPWDSDALYQDSALKLLGSGED